jgi:hypothetical protein
MLFVFDLPIGRNEVKYFFGVVAIGMAKHDLVIY